MNPDYRPLKKLAKTGAFSEPMCKAILDLFDERAELLRRIEILEGDRAHWIAQYVALKEKHGL